MSSIDISEIRNTRSMDMTPQRGVDCEFIDDTPGGGRAGLMPFFDGASFIKVVNYPIMVEMWEKTKFGRIKREFCQKFTDAERNTLARYYARFYRWRLVTGTPAKIVLRMKTLQLLQRAVQFFASV